MQSRVLAILVLLIAVLPATVRADAPDPSKLVHIDPGTEITFDLESGRIPAALPFDVPFFLVSEIPGTSKAVDVNLVGPRLKKNAGCPDGRPVCATLGKTGPSDARKRIVRIHMPELDSDSDYSLEVDLTRERDAEESKKIVEALRAPLLELYQNEDQAKVAEEAGGREFRRRLLGIVQRAVAPARVVPEKDSYLDPSVSFASVTMRKVFEGPFERTLQARQAIEQYLRARPSRLKRRPLLTPDATVEELDEELGAIQSDLEPFDTTQGPGKELALDLRFVAESLEDAKRLLVLRDAAIDRVSKQIDEWLVDHYDVVATTTQSYEARFHSYVSADLGVGVAPELDDFFRYVGMNVYLKPVNKKARLRGLDLRKRLAITVGLADKLSGDDRTGVLNERPVLLGAGWRITSHVRLSGGGLFIKEDDPDPLVTKKSLAVTWYGAASIDFDVASTVKGFFEAFTK